MRAIEGDYVWAPDSRHTARCAKGKIVLTDVDTGEKHTLVRTPREISLAARMLRELVPPQVNQPGPASTVSGRRWISLRPDLGKGRGSGWAMPLASIVRQHNSYCPTEGAVSNAAQWAMV